MGYFIDPEGNYPRHAGDVQITHPEWQEGIDPLPEGWVEVAEGTIPEFGPDQYIAEADPAEVDGVLTRQFTVIDMTEEQIRERTVWQIRNKIANHQPITAEEALLLVG